MNKKMPLSVEKQGMGNKISGICMAEYGLTGFEGHYFNYVNSVYKASNNLPLQFIAIAGNNVPEAIEESFPVIPIFRVLSFRRYLNRPLKFLFDPILANWYFYRDLRSLEKKFKLHQNWLVLSVTAENSNLFAWALWLKRYKPSKSPVLVLMLRFSYFNGSTNRWRPSSLWLRAGLAILERYADRFKIIFTTDSDVLAEEYRRLTTIPIHVLPIPHTSSTQFKDLTSTKTDRSIRMVSLGGVRLSKGFGILARAIKKLSEDNNLHGLTFSLQCYQSQWGSSGAESVSLLKSLALPNVELIEYALSEEEYLQLLENSDVVLIPFFRDVYRGNTSGTFTEALAAGKPVVVTSGTWMSSQLDHFGAGVVFLDQDVNDLARAMCEMRDNYFNLAALAEARRADWIEFHSPQNFLDKLLKLGNEIKVKN
jgi:glycosyltransferase involved in cell wall biosynthesis